MLDELQRQGVELRVEGDRLHFKAPAGSLGQAQKTAISAHRNEVLALLRARSAAVHHDHPLSYGQQAIWLLEQAAPGSAVNNLGVAIRTTAGFPPEHIRDAAQRLVDRHPALRTTYHGDTAGDVFQRVAGAGAAGFEVVQAEGIPPGGIGTALQADRDRPFDLENGPMLRVALYQGGATDQIVLLATHHIGADGLSMLLLAHELLASIVERGGGPAADLPLPAVQQTDRVHAERDLVDSAEGERLLAEWRDRLDGAAPACALPSDRSRAGLPGFHGASVPLLLDQAATAGLKALAREERTTVFVVLLASFHMFLARLTGAIDGIVGTSVSQRSSEQTHHVVGNYVNALPIRARMRWSMTFRDVVAIVREATLGALEAQAYPVQLLVNRLRPPRGGAGGAFPFFNTFFTFQKLDAERSFAALVAGFGGPQEFRGHRLEPFWLPNQAGQFDLTLGLADFEESIRGHLHYATELFDETTVQRLASDYAALLDAMIAEPGTRLLSPEQRRAVLDHGRGPTPVLDGAPFVTQFARAATVHPAACAIRCGDVSLDYAALECRANRLARRLRDNGAGPGMRIGLYAGRSPAMLVSLLAIQKSGAAYVPLDPGFPDHRLALMVADSGMALLLSDAGAPSWLHGAVPPVLDIAGAAEAGSAADGEPLATGPHPEDIAYVLYTSGSTGLPNGVAITHAALSNLLGSMLREPGLRAGERLAAVTTISFDIAALELYLPLLAGGAVELLSRAIAADGPTLARALATSGTTVMQATPATWRLLIEADWRPPPGFRAFSGGEHLPSALAAELLSRGVEVWNLYGPTETTIWSTAGRVTDAGFIDAGHPIANTRIYILDAALDLLPPGQAGDVWIAGDGVAAGYHDRDALTRDRFRTDPFHPARGARMYRTGDIGRWTDAGRLTVLGRSDDQIKLRGFRIELPEIEAALEQHPDVRRAVVGVHRSGADMRLIAYVVYHLGAEPVTGELRRHVRALLPDYMLPAVFVELDAVPMTPNGKIDRRSLPDPFATGRPALDQVAPAPGLEQVIAGIWRDVLKLESVGAHDNFFDIGGHSLLSLKAEAAFERATGRSLPARIQFTQTLRQIASVMSDRHPA